MTASEEPMFDAPKVLGRRHIRFTRTVKREIDGRGICADLVLEAHFPLDFQPERYELDLVKSKGDGRVTIELRPEVQPLRILDAGATVVNLGAPATETSFMDLDQALQDELAQREDEVKLEIARLQGRAEALEPAQVAPPASRAALLSGAATQPLKRF